MEDKCKYCGRAKEEGKLRCDICNIAWLEGHEAGMKDTAFEIRCLWDKFKEIINS